MRADFNTRGREVPEKQQTKPLISERFIGLILVGRALESILEDLDTIGSQIQKIRRETGCQVPRSEHAQAVSVDGAQWNIS